MAGGSVVCSHGCVIGCKLGASASTFERIPQNALCVAAMRACGHGQPAEQSSQADALIAVTWQHIDVCPCFVRDSLLKPTASAKLQMAVAKLQMAVAYAFLW